MKFISYNVRGLGGKAKKLDVRRLIAANRPDVISIQETKLETIDRRTCTYLWGFDDFEFITKDADGRAGGILMMWNKNSFILQGTITLSFALLIKGVWLKENVQVILLSVYAPCERNNKLDCWEEISGALESHNGGLYCVMGDFNSICAEDERKGVQTNSRSAEIDDFNNFILEAALIDLPMAGKKYTWWRSNGLSMSRIDRFLVSEAWLLRWPNCSVWGMDRSLSDHCPIALINKVVDWGPKPFRMLKC